MHRVAQPKKMVMGIFGAAALAAAAGSASAQWSPSDEPKVWWEVGQQTFYNSYPTQIPSSTAYDSSLLKNSGRLVTAVRNKITFVDTSDPESWAEFVCAQIQDRQLTAGNVAIQPIDFGAGGRADLPAYSSCNRLAWDPDDDLAEPTDEEVLDCPNDSTNYTEYFKPWLDNGIVDTQTWMEAFCERYNELRTASLEDEEAWDIPLPTKWMLDIESSNGNIFSSTAVNSFYVSMQDPRWSSSSYPVLGLGSNPGTGEKMSDYWASKGYPEPECDITYNNWTYYDHWAVYQFDVDNLSFSAALKASTADVLTSYWPDCKFSNYGTAAADGVLNANLPPYTHRRGLMNTGFASGDNVYTRVGVKTVWNSEDPEPYMHAPTLTGASGYIYTNGSFQCRYCTLLDNMSISNSTERARAALLLASREDVESIVYSYGGQDPATISPYISFPNYNTVLSTGFYRRYLAQFRRLGVKEFNLWSDVGVVDYTNADTFTDELLHLLDQVWSTEVDDVSVITGTPSGTPTAADLKVADLEGAEVSGTQYTEIEVEFVGKLVNYDRFRVVVESSATNGSSVAIEPDVEIQLYDYASASFVTVPSTSINWWPSNPNKTQETTATVETRMDLDSCGVREYFDFISPSGGVLVRIKHDAGSGVTCNSVFDVVQVYQLDDGKVQALDTNNDKMITSGDITDFYTNYSTYTTSPCNAACNFNLVNGTTTQDTYDYNTAWLGNTETFKNTD